MIKIFKSLFIIALISLVVFFICSTILNPYPELAFIFGLSCGMFLLIPLNMIWDWI
jgi:hypothetical protein